MVVCKKERRKEGFEGAESTRTRGCMNICVCCCINERTMQANTTLPPQCLCPS